MLSKRMLAALAPLLAVAAFAVIPAMAQAAPHWYRNGARLTFGGAHVPVTTHSTPAGLTLLAPGAEVKCTVKDTGDIWNPALTMPGLDEVLTFENTACAPSVPPCKAGETVTLDAEKLPWATHLIAGAPIRDAIEGVTISILCNGVLLDTFSGTLTPLVHNGTTGTEAGCTAETDTYLEFDHPGSGQLEDAAKNVATADGRDCIWGSSANEVITVVDP